MMKYYIYVLLCPLAKAPRYIGKTCNPESRLSAHISKARYHETSHHCSDWIRSLLARNLKPTLEIIFEVPAGEQWQDHEKRFIADYRRRGFDLTNFTGGGEGFYEPNPELLKRRGLAISNAFKDPERRQKRRESATEIGSRAVVKALRSKGAANAWADPEKKARMLAGMRTPEAKARRAEATRRRHADPAFAAKHAVKMKELFEREDRREQIKAAGAKRWRDHRERGS